MRGVIVLLTDGKVGALQVDGVVNAETEHQGRDGHFQRREPCPKQVQQPVGPDQRHGQAGQREGHAACGTERQSQDEHDHDERQNDEQCEAVKGGVVNVVGNQVQRNRTVGQRRICGNGRQLLTQLVLPDFTLGGVERRIDVEHPQGG